MKYFKIFVVAAILTFSLEFADAAPLTTTVEPTAVQLPPPPPRPPLPFSKRHHRRYKRHHRGVHIRLPKLPPPPPAPPRP